MAYLGEERQPAAHMRDTTQSNSRRHQLWVKLDGVVPKLRDCDRLEALRALRKVRVALNPAEAVHVCARPALVLVLIVLCEADLLVHVNTMHFGTRVEERKVEKVAVECRHNRRLHLLDVLEEAHDRRGLRHIVLAPREAFQVAHAPRRAR
jgi:hypothetical protein